MKWVPLAGSTTEAPDLNSYLFRIAKKESNPKYNKLHPDRQFKTYLSINKEGLSLYATHFNDGDNDKTERATRSNKSAPFANGAIFKIKVKDCYQTYGDWETRLCERKDTLKTGHLDLRIFKVKSGDRDHIHSDDIKSNSMLKEVERNLLKQIHPLFENHSGYR